jgi:xanthine dehydrogenase small subunit
VAELHEFSQAAGLIRIGAALPLNAIAARWTNPPEAFRQWLPLFASPPVRNRATLGGNLATASPVGDAAPLLIALEATLHLVGPNGRRQVPVDTFFAGYRSTVLDPGELVTAIELPDRTATLTRFYKVAKRRVDDISTVAAGLSLDLDAAGRIRRARFGFGGIAATPLRATGAEEAVIGLPWNLSTVARAQAALARSLHPIGDHRGSAEYRLGVSKALIEKLWWDYEEAAA